MKLTCLRIDLMKYGEDAGKYCGKASFTCQQGDVSVNLSPEHIERIFQIAADTVIETSREVATAMTCHVIEQREGAQLRIIDPEKPYSRR